MKPRQLLMGAAALTLSALFSASCSQPEQPPQTDNDQAAYDHFTLNRATLDQYPDSGDSVLKILASDAMEDKTVIVELSADWCPFCARLKPEMDKALTSLANQGADIARLTVIYQEGDYKTHSKGAYAYQKTVGQLSQSGAFPEVQIWQDGKPLFYFTGAVPAEEIERLLKENIEGLIPDQSADLQFAPGPNPA